MKSEELQQSVSRLPSVERDLPALPGTSLVICSRNRPQLLADTIHSVLAGNEIPSELIVVDQSDTEHAALASGSHLPGGCALRYMWSRSVGVSRGRNLAIAAAAHSLLVILDDDMFVEPNWFGALVRAQVNAGERAVVTGRVLPIQDIAAGGFVPALVTDDRPAVYQGRMDRAVLAGGHMAAYRSAFDRIGGFDERLGPGSRFPAADDNDLGFRLLEAGYRIVYVPEAVIYHRAWRPARDYLVMRWRYGRGKGAFYAKYFSLRDRLMLSRLLHDIGRRVLAFPGRIRTEPRRARGDIIYSLGVLLGAVQWSLSQLRTRKFAGM